MMPIKPALIALLAVLLLFGAEKALARSALSPRHSGIEPPGGPRQLDVLPGNSPGRTAEGGMGYMDAYGRTLTDKLPEEKKARRRLRSGAYGSHTAETPEAVLPEKSAPPVWTFR